MRPIAFVTLLGLAACSENVRFVPVEVVWMDWPAEVATEDPFRTRLVVWQPCALIRGFDPSPTADASAVTFAPFFIVERDQIACILTAGVASELLVQWAIDTAGIAPGLPAADERIYEMRSAGGPSCAVCANLNTVPWVSFGYVTVRPTFPTSLVRNAAGIVTVQRDSAGCTRIRPAGLPALSGALVVENPPDTTVQWGGFVRGYIYEPAAPVCGESRVFHLTGTWN